MAAHVPHFATLEAKRESARRFEKQVGVIAAARQGDAEQPLSARIVNIKGIIMHANFPPETGDFASSRNRFIIDRMPRA
jgi:hypothetical protein